MQQPIFPIFHVGEIVRAYPVNKKYSFNATICRIESGNTVVVRWHEEGSDNIAKGLPISRLRKITKNVHLSTLILKTTKEVIFLNLITIHSSQAHATKTYEYGMLTRDIAEPYSKDILIL